MLAYTEYPDALWGTLGTPSKGKKVRKIFKKVLDDEKDIIQKKRLTDFLA